MNDGDHKIQRDRLAPVVSLLSTLIVGVVVGCTLSWALLFSAADSIVPWTDTALQLALPTMGAFSLLLVIALPVSVFMVRHFVAQAKGTLEEVVSKVFKAVEAKGDGDSLAALHHSEAAVLEVVAWYAPKAARRWIVQACFALLIAVGGLAGTALLFRQTMLLGEQNAKIDMQTVVAESSQRRATLTAELFSLLQSIGSDSSELSELELTRLIAFSQSATPYHTIEIEGDGVGKSPKLSRLRSIERGQLLSALAQKKRFISDKIVFDNADLRGANLQALNASSTRLFQADLSRSDLSGAVLNGAILHKASFEGATVSGTQFVAAKMRSVSMSGLMVDRAKFDEAELDKTVQMPAARFHRARIIDTSFVGSFLSEADFSEARLSGVDFSKADLSKANFRGARHSSQYAAPGGGAGEAVSDRPSPIAMRGALLRNADFTDSWFAENVDWDGAIVSYALMEGTNSLPADFPKGWSGPPLGWHIVIDNGLSVLRRVVRHT